MGAGAMTQELVIACFIQALHIAPKHRPSIIQFPKKRTCAWHGQAFLGVGALNGKLEDLDPNPYIVLICVDVVFEQKGGAQISWYRNLAKETCVITGYYTYTEKNLMPQDKSLIEAPSCSLPSMYLFIHRSYLSTMHKNNKTHENTDSVGPQKWGPYPTIENRHDFFKGASVLDKPIVRAPQSWIGLGGHLVNRGSWQRKPGERSTTPCQVGGWRGRGRANGVHWGGWRMMENAWKVLQTSNVWW